MSEVLMKKLRPYGAKLDDGAVQLSFTLPIKASPVAKEAARQYAEKLNLERVSVVAMEPMGEQFTYFVICAHAKPTINITKVKAPKGEAAVQECPPALEEITIEESFTPRPYREPLGVQMRAEAMRAAREKRHKARPARPHVARRGARRRGRRRSSRKIAK